MSFLDELTAALEKLDPEKRARLAKVASSKLSQDWLPAPGPQTQAYLSKADVLLYGGAAGGGKTDLCLGLALTHHERSVFFRRAYVDLQGAEERLIEVIGTRDGYNGQKMILHRGNRILEFGALEKPNAEYSWQGRAHDLIVIDEGAQIPEDKVAFVTGWNRSARPGQRCRVVIATNPPTGAEGAWIKVWFAPWLDPLFPDPAVPGELRWAIRVDKTVIWVKGAGIFGPDGEPFMGEGKSYTAQSYTFIPAMLDDNPYLRGTDYRAKVENMPEPLRSQLLYGDFLAGQKDDDWQVIPSAWVEAAQERFRKYNAASTRLVMMALAGDMAGGGRDEVVVQPLLNSFDDDWYFPEPKTMAGISQEDSGQIAIAMLMTRKDNADLSLDGTGGWGSGVLTYLKTQHKIDCHSIVFSRASNVRARDKVHTFRNLRAELWWRFREALDPSSDVNVMLYPDKKLKAQLTAPRYKVVGTDIVVESKEEIRKRLGSSTDRGDGVVMAWHRRKASGLVQPTTVPGLPRMPKPAVLPNTRDSWMLK